MYALMETVLNWKDEAKFARVVAVVTRPESCMPRLQHPLEGQAYHYMACGIPDVAYRELIVATHFQNNE